MTNPKSQAADEVPILELDINLDDQPPAIQALGILAVAGQHLNEMLTIQGRIAQLMKTGHVLPGNSVELHNLLVQSAFQLSKLADFNSLQGCDVLVEAHHARHPVEQGLAELQAHKDAGRTLN